MRFGDSIVENKPELIANITWSSLLSKEIGKVHHKRSIAIPLKNNEKYLYLYMNRKSAVNIMI